MVSEYISGDIISILLFVSPGFLTIALIGKFYGITINMEQFEKTTWSLIASVPIGITFFYINSINQIDLFLEYFISHPFSSLFQISLLSMVLAIFISMILKSNLLEKISRKIVYINESSVLADHSVWDGFMKRNYRKPVIVKTPDLEYKGWLSANSIREERKEIVLDQPVIVYTDDEGTTQDFPCGGRILLFGEDIKSITVLEET
jgi:hypothetical protein